MNRFITILHKACKWALAIIMMAAALSKIGDLREFVEYIEKFPLLFISAHSLWFAKLIIAIELTIAIRLITAEDCTLTCVIAGVLLIAFTIFQYAAPSLIGSAAGCPCINSKLIAEWNDSLTFRVVRNLVLLLFAILTIVLSPAVRMRRRAGMP